MRVSTESGFSRKKAPQPQNLPPLKVATMSFEVHGGGSDKRLVKANRSVDAIMDALCTHRPDVLLVAGYSLHDDAAHEALKERLEKSDWDGLLFVEVRNHAENLPGRALPRRIDGAPQQLSSHCLFAWTRDTGWKCLGRQYFVSSAQARKNAGNVVPAFVENLPNRTIEFKVRRFGALICGEINALRAEKTGVVRPLTPEIGAWLRNLDVVVNATHDRMGWASILGAKRSWFSQGGRAYLSSSNWNSSNKRPQSRNARTLHTFYLDGNEMPQSRQTTPHPDYEYREGVLPSRSSSSATQPISSSITLPLKTSKNMEPQKLTPAAKGNEPAKASSAPKGKASQPLWEMLKSVYPDVQCEAKFDWLVLPRVDKTSGADQQARARGVAAEVRAALIEDCRKHQHLHANLKKRQCTPEQLAAELMSPRMSSMEFDFYIPSLKLAIEFDERQHFSAERAVSLAAYKGRVQTGFDVREWIERCNTIKAVDADPVWRDWQRAYRDAMRDMLAARHGVRLVRYRFDAMPGIEEIKALARLEAMSV